MSDPRRQRVLISLLLATVALAASMAARYLSIDGAHMQTALITAGMFGVGVALGSAFLISSCVLTSARWWIPVHRLPDALSRLLLLPLALVAAALVGGRADLYEWLHPEAVTANPLLQAKAFWLNDSFFLLRAGVVMLIWLGIVSALSQRLPGVTAAAGSADRTRLVRSAVFFVLLLAPTLSVASWDWVMSLEPEWFSTMFGVYIFSGFFLTGLAATAAIASAPNRAVEVEAGVLSDLGKLLFAFSCFWAYIWFCQYMLIWYANIPEEATYFVRRETPGWVALFWLVPVLSFVVPFVILMGQRAKRTPSVLFQVSLVVLAGRWLDLYVMVAPATIPTAAPWLALGWTALLLGGMALLLAPGTAGLSRVTAERGTS